MFRIYKVNIMPLGLVMEVPGFGAESTKYWDDKQKIWVETYSVDCVKMFGRESSNVREPDYRAQFVDLGSEIFDPRIIGKLYSVDVTSTRRLELVEIMTRPDLIRMAGLLL